MTREAAEARHAQRPFVDQREHRQRVVSQVDRIFERRIDQTRARGLER